MYRYIGKEWPHIKYHILYPQLDNFLEILLIFRAASNESSNVNGLIVKGLSKLTKNVAVKKCAVPFVSMMNISVFTSLLKFLWIFGNPDQSFNWTNIFWTQQISIIIIIIRIGC